MKQQVAKFQSLAQANYLLKTTSNPDDRLIILNHGFMSSSERMWNRFIDHLPKNCHILAPNGPFPIPTKQENSWKVRYSWFFFDNFDQTFLIGYDVCTDFIKNLCGELGFASNKKTIVGYSQGGYVAPHMAEGLTNVDHIIGIGCRFKIKNPQWPEDLIIEAVHGEDDDVVEWSGAQESFLSLPKIHQGRIESFANTGHKPTPAMLQRVSQWIQEKSR